MCWGDRPGFESSRGHIVNLRSPGFLACIMGGGIAVGIGGTAFGGGGVYCGESSVRRGERPSKRVRVWRALFPVKNCLWEKIIYSLLTCVWAESKSRLDFVIVLFGYNTKPFLAS